MSANVETMMYTGETPWHGIGTKVDEAPDSATAIKMAGLDWQVTQENVRIGRSVVDGYKANVRSSDKKVLGITSDRYEVVQNADAFAFTDAMIGAGCKYETAGSLKEGKIVWLLALTDQRKILGDDINQYLTFVNGFDGKTPVKVFDTSTRIVCSNTLQLALSGAKRVWTFEHSTGVQDRLREFQITMTNARNYMDNLEKFAEKLHKQIISKKKLEEILSQVYGDETEFKDQKMKQERISRLKNRLITVYNDTADLQNHRGTAWGLYNAFADVAGHGTPTNNKGEVRERRFLSYIDGNKLLASAQKAILSVA
jgi:phage/plasmid-like protein (TIGR03299 family)